MLVKFNGMGQAFFITSAAEKTKTQAENSSQKLKEKTQPQGVTFLFLKKLKKKSQFYWIFSKKNQKSFQGVPLLMPFLSINISNFNSLYQSATNIYSSVGKTDILLQCNQPLFSCSHYLNDNIGLFLALQWQRGRVRTEKHQ